MCLNENGIADLHSKIAERFSARFQVMIYLKFGTYFTSEMQNSTDFLFCAKQDSDIIFIGELRMFNKKKKKHFYSTIS